MLFMSQQYFLVARNDILYRVWTCSLCVNHTNVNVLISMNSLHKEKEAQLEKQVKS